MYIFDGRTAGIRLETEVQQFVRELEDEGTGVKIAAVLFKEDLGSRYYSEYKKLAAERVGIEYELHPFSIASPVSELEETIKQLNADPSITGIIIQKPVRKTWADVMKNKGYDTWWHDLYSLVDPAKDVDGLHPTTIASIKNDTWKEEGRVLPATCRAVLKILNHQKMQELIQPESKFLVIGKSDLLGQPLYYFLSNEGRAVEMIGRNEFRERMESGTKLKDADVIITATGKEYLVTGSMIKQGAAIIDVGEPRPDVDQESIAKKAAFLTPVPGGVGPLTVASLLENAVFLARKQQK